MPENCWLIFVNPSTLTVGLYRSDTSPQEPNQAIGTEINWSFSDPQSLVQAASMSLESAASTLQLAESQEPEQAIFIVPPSWVENGALYPRYKSLLEPILRNLKLKPLGFLSQDELVVEALSKTAEGQPSFIFLSLFPSSFSLSLISFGQHQLLLPTLNFLSSEFIPTLEKALYELKSNYAIPPRIILFGPKNNQLQTELTSYRWQNPSYPDIFLQLPEIQLWHYTEFLELFHYLVGKPPTTGKLVPNSLSNSSQDSAQLLTQISPGELGFTSDPPPTLVETDMSVPDLSLPDKLEPTPPPDRPVVGQLNKPKLTLRFPRPHISLPTPSRLVKLSAIPAAIFLLVLFAFILLPSVNITIFVTPQQFQQPTLVSINQPSTGDQIGLTTTILNQDIQVSSTISTTGTKVTGQKAKGEVVIFNKSDKVLNLPKGTILTSSASLSYELSNPVQVPAAAANFERGIIEMGQTKVAMGASNFGPEYNLSGAQDYKLKDYPELVARSNISISGGTKQDVKTVAPADKSRLISVLDAAVQKELTTLASSQKDPLLISNSAFIKNKKVDTSREVGEEASELTGIAKLSVSFHQLPLPEKKKLVDSLVSPTATQNRLKYLVENFSVSFPTAPTSNTYVGNLQVDGWLEPRISSKGLAAKLILKAPSSLPQVLKSEVARFYDWEISSRLGYIKVIPLLPAMTSQIHLSFKVK